MSIGNSRSAEGYLHLTGMPHWRYANLLFWRLVNHQNSVKLCVYEEPSVTLTAVCANSDSDHVATQRWAACSCRLGWFMQAWMVHV